MAEDHCESIEVMKDMTCALDHLAAVMEKSNLNLGGSEASSGKMKPSKDDSDVIELGGGEGVSKEGSDKGSGGDEELLDVGLSQLKKRKLR